MNRRWVYWGIPLIGGLIGTVVTIIMFIRKVEQPEPFDNQLDAFIGVVIWFAIIQFTFIGIKIAEKLSG